MSRWVRLHQSALHNPKLVNLSDRQFRAWANMLLIADEDGSLPKTRDVASHLRMSFQDAELIISELVENDLIDMSVLDGVRTFKMHDWKTHQYISDTSTERVRKFRNKNKRNIDETFQKPLHAVTVTPPDSDSDTETDNSLGSTSFTAAAREVKNQGDYKFVRKKSELKGKDRLAERAEGLGLPVDEFERACSESNIKRSVLFTDLCIDALSKKLPGLDRQLIRSALWDRQNDLAYRKIESLLLEVA